MPVNKKHFDLSKRVEVETFNKNAFEVYDLNDDVKQLQTLVFSADPNTGNPTSDVAIMLSGSDPAFQQFIKDRLMSVQPSSILADNEDEAVSLVHKNLVTAEEYQQLVHDYVINQMKSQEVDDVKSE